MGMTRRHFLAAGAATAGVALSGCGLFDKRVDVLLVGDSIMSQSQSFVKSQLRAQKGLDDVSTYAKAVNGSGIMSPHVFDWQTEARNLIGTYKPSVTVALFVGNYTDDNLFIGADGNEIANDYSERFYEEWGRQAEVLTKTLQSGNGSAYWVLPPPFLGDEGKRREGLLRDTYVKLAQRMPGVGLIDGRQALGDATGAFAWDLPGPDGRPVKVRAGDSVHLTEVGGERMAKQIAFDVGPKLLDLRRQNAT